MIFSVSITQCFNQVNLHVHDQPPNTKRTQQMQNQISKERIK